MQVSQLRVRKKCLSQCELRKFELETKWLLYDATSPDVVSLMFILFAIKITLNALKHLDAKNSGDFAATHTRM